MSSLTSLISYRHIVLAGALLVAGSVHAQSQTGNGEVSAYRGILNQYCISCHNEVLKTANIMLDKANVDDLSQDPQLWEKVITKLSLRAMPPVGFPVRPDEAQYRQMITYLKGGLDELAKAHPDPGTPVVHRLNRTEYTNAIRDLLDLQIDASIYLPADNIAEGFDNIAEALSVSPLLMEQYMFAATQISRLAVGPDNMMPVSESYVIPDEYQQDSRIDENLPFGARGGISIQHHFPADGEYTVRVRLARNLEGYIRGMQKKNLLDVRLDHERMQLFEIGGEVHGKSGPLFTDSQNVDFAGDDDQVGYEFSADKDMEIRFPATAGTRTLAVAFLDDSAKTSGFAEPALTIRDIASYKGGDPTVLSVTVTGPYETTGAGDTPSRNRIFTCRPASADDLACPESILTRLAHLAYRRPVSDTEKASLMRLYRKWSADGGFESGIEMALQGILAGPEFLFRVEQGPTGKVDENGIYRISDLDLASRLSFFLWSSIPDEELLTVAERGELTRTPVLRQQVRRMMADSRFSAFIDNFGSQWLNLRNLSFVAPQSEIFPEFDGELRVAMREEIARWFESMVREDRSVVELLTSDYTYVNERLAKFYGIPDVYGSNFRRVTLADPMRQGLLGKAGLLTVTSFNNRTSPVVRGNWVLENLLDMAPPPPPADAFQPDLKSADDTGRILTMKESMELHRSNPVCANCHKMMEPIGLALENFNAIGLYRDRYVEADADVDASGILFDGSHFDDTMGFKREFMKYSDKYVETVTKKIYTYAMGRSVEYKDRPVIRDIVSKAKSDGHTWSSLIMGIIESSPFQYRRIQP